MIVSATDASPQETKNFCTHGRVTPSLVSFRQSAAATGSRCFTPFFCLFSFLHCLSSNLPFGKCAQLCTALHHFSAGLRGHYSPACTSWSVWRYEIQWHPSYSVCAASEWIAILGWGFSGRSFWFSLEKDWHFGARYTERKRLLVGDKRFQNHRKSRGVRNKHKGKSVSQVREGHRWWSIKNDSQYERMDGL